MSRSKGESAQGGAEGNAGAPVPGTGGILPARGSTLAPGTMLGKYRIVRALGAGGMAAVYEALHTGIGKPVAIKTLRALTTDSRAEARFLREAAAASRLDHPHVVDVTDFGTEQGLSYLVMELLRGEDMGALIERDKGKLDPSFVADVMLAVCAGVFAAHESGVVHRDLKPQNIFLARTPLGELVPKVLDFGISKRLDEDVASALTGSGALLGTTHYLSPEQVAGKPLDVRSDQYALGVILYEALTGRKPHDGASAYAIMHSIGEGAFALPRKIRSEIGSALESVVVRAMSARPQDRFESVHGLGRALLPHASSKKRVIWSDYYERDRPPVSPGAPPSFPNPPRPPVAEENTAALDKKGKKADQTRTRVLHAARPMAATRVAMPVAKAPTTEQPPAQKPRSEAVPKAKAKAAPGKFDGGAKPGGLRRAIVITGLIALGAGGYAAWVDPDIAERVPQEVKAGLKRALPPELAGKAQAGPIEPVAHAGPPPTEKRMVLPKETKVMLPTETAPLKGGLRQPTAEETETFNAEHPEVKPPVAEGQPQAGESGEPPQPPQTPQTPEDLSAAGSPVPALIAPPAVERAAGRRIMVPPPIKAQDPRRGMRPPYTPVDANQRLLRFLKNKPPVWTPDTTHRDTDPEPRSQPRLVNPTGAPILE